MSEAEEALMIEPDASDPDFEALLEYIHRSRSFDFTGYKRSSLMRRVSKRMHMVGVEGFAAYHDYLEVHPEEFRALFDTILINVTGFFRDPSTWEAISTEILPRLLSASGPRSRFGPGAPAAPPARRPTAWPSPRPPSATA